MRLNSRGDDRVTQEAARWLGVLLHRRGGSREFFSWLQESPRHVEEFLFVLADAQDLASLSPTQRALIDDLSRELGLVPDKSNVVPFSAAANPLPNASPVQKAPADRPAKTNRDFRAQPGWGISIAASLLLAVGFVWWLHGPGAWKTYTTKVGEQRAVTLADGSIVHLNTDSSVSVRLIETARDIRLTRGEALFTVKRDPGRPFLVRTSNAVIQAIGTRFNVYNRAGTTNVAVLEGLVQVSNTRDIPSMAKPEAPDSVQTDADRQKSRLADAAEFLRAGEAADVSQSGTVSSRRTVDPIKTVAWRQRRLVFENDSLGEIAEEFNRYNATIKIRVVGDGAIAERFSGTFDADAPEAMMQALVGDSALRVERVGGEIVISPRGAQQ